MAPRQHTTNEFVAAGVLAVATVTVCWPWALSGRQVFVQWDALWTQLSLQHLMDAVVGRAALLDAPLAPPVERGTTMADWILGQAVLGAPLHLLGVPVWRIHNVAVAGGLFATAYGCHRIAAALVGPGPHTWIAGLIGGLGPMQLVHAQHLNLVHHEAAVLGGLALAAGLLARRPWLAAGGGLALGAASHLGVYMGAHAALVAAVTLAVCAAWRRGSTAAWLAAGGGLVLGALTVLPVATAYLSTARQHELWLDDEFLTEEVWDPAATFAPTATAPLHDLVAVDAALEPPLVVANPGYLALVLAVVGIAAAARDRERRAGWAIVAGVGGLAALLALGPELVWAAEPTGIPGPYRLLLGLPGARGLQAPGRWLALTGCAAGVAAAAASRWITARWRHPAAAPTLALVCGVILVLETPRVHTSPTWSLGLTPAQAAIAAMPGTAPVASIRDRDATCECLGRDDLWASLLTRRPLAGVAVSRTPVGLARYRQAIDSWPSPTSLELLRITGVEFVIEHPPLDPIPPPGLDCSVLDRHRLCRLDIDAAPVIPRSRDVVEDSAGPVIGLRWPDDIAASWLTLRCGETWTDVVALEPWRRLAAVRSGGTPPALDVFFDEPCPQIPDGAPADPRTLFHRLD